MLLVRLVNYSVSLLAKPLLQSACQLDSWLFHRIMPVSLLQPRLNAFQRALQLCKSAA
jgi:hypothetical protein